VKLAHRHQTTVMCKPLRWWRWRRRDTRAVSAAVDVMHYTRIVIVWRVWRGGEGIYSDDGGEDMLVKLSFTLLAKFSEVSSRGVSDDGCVGLHTHTQARGTSNAV